MNGLKAVILAGSLPEARKARVDLGLKPHEVFLVGSERSLWGLRLEPHVEVIRTGTYAQRRDLADIERVIKMNRQKCRGNNL